MADQIIQGSFLRIFGVGTLIQGAPGIGKSELALSLLYQQHQLIADDAAIFSIREGQIRGCSPVTHQFLSIRGIGLIDPLLHLGPNSICAEASLDLIIKLAANPAMDYMAHLEGLNSVETHLGCLIPCVTIPIIEPRNLLILTQTIVKNYLIRHNKDDLPLVTIEKLLQQKMESPCS